MTYGEIYKKVIDGLECCTHGVNKCAICPYDPRYNKIDEINARSCMTQLAMDALELLKAQEPRVLTLEEALEADVCWLEIEGADRVPPCRIGGGVKCVTIRRFDQVPEVALLDEYGKLFRCWSARPTDEQRAATPWEPPKEG